MHLLSLHTVFILNENIQWLEEYIEYYRKIGFDHFYLYHNEGSIGDIHHGGSSTHTKYNIPMSTTSSQTDLDKLQVILDKYNEYITYVKWQPRNHNGEIVYGQIDALYDCIKRFGNQTEWLAILDLDEYLFSPSNMDLRVYFKELDSNTSCIKVCQKKFKDRHLSTKSKILEEFECIDLFVGEWWGAKNIFRPYDLINASDIHAMSFKNTTHVIDQNILRFNHYNVNEKQISWMQWSMGRPFKLDSIDDGMTRYLKTD